MKQFIAFLVIMLGICGICFLLMESVAVLDNDRKAREMKMQVACGSAMIETERGGWVMCTDGEKKWVRHWHE